jgi:hypothetical protein
MLEDRRALHAIEEELQDFQRFFGILELDRQSAAQIVEHRDIVRVQQQRATDILLGFRDIAEEHQS